MPALAAPEFEESFRLDPNPRRALFAAEAWARAGEPAAARSALARARATGPLLPELEASARRIEVLVARMTADSARAAGEAAPARP